jgi:outer membrane protein assembly factor BamA
MRLDIPCVLLLFALPAATQDARFPLESLAIEGSKIPQPAILEISGLRVGTPIDKSGIDESCSKLQMSGLFSSVSYRYAPGPKKGYAVTLKLEDQNSLEAATIDIPGFDEKEIWEWLTAKYLRFDHKVPGLEVAHVFLSGEIERHLGGRRGGRHLTVRMETDFATGRGNLSFQPEVLPKLEKVSYVGNAGLTGAQLAAVLDPVVANADFTERKFAAMVDMNLRPVYEEHGYHRVRFTPGRPQIAESGVSVSVTVAEGAQYQLGKVVFVGDDLPEEKMLSAAKFPFRKTANGRQIQEGVYAVEKVVKRSGYFEAGATAERTLDDAAHMLDLRIKVHKGPLYHFGDLQITGLNKDFERMARKLWKPKPGDPYDYAYSNDFFQAFSHEVDVRSLRSFKAQSMRGTGDHVININLIFE